MYGIIMQYGTQPIAATENLQQSPALYNTQTQMKPLWYAVLCSNSSYSYSTWIQIFKAEAAGVWLESDLPYQVAVKQKPRPRFPTARH